MNDFGEDDAQLLDELGVEVEAEKPGVRTPREERLLVGFQDIQRFVQQYGREPQHGEDNDIFERLYAVRLDRLRESVEHRAILAPLDHQALLGGPAESSIGHGSDHFTDDELLSQLDVDAATTDITDLRHVRSAAEKSAADEIASRRPCTDFCGFEPLFARVRAELKSGARTTRPVSGMAEIREGEFFIVGGQIAYVAQIGKEFITEYERRDSRLRVIYDNGTESDVLQRSLQRALHRDGTGRRITDSSPGPLFADISSDEDEVVGTIYVLRSHSTDPAIAAHREVLHKIGVTGGKVDRRMANAHLDPTFLMADVEVVASYELANLNRVKLENVIHRVFASARLKIEIKDRFGNSVVPREWFLVPLFVIDEAVDKIRDGSIVNFTYDPTAGALVRS